MRCEHCGKELSAGDGPDSNRCWCDDRCLAAWEAEHPGETEGWVRVEDATPEQRAELLALLGKGESC